jgi:hypothetical protein
MPYFGALCLNKAYRYKNNNAHHALDTIHHNTLAILTTSKTGKNKNPPIKFIKTMPSRVV